MASIIRLICCFCVRGVPSNQNEPDERTPILQAPDDTLPVQNYTVDHQKMRERLGHIVRSKEGKMVNVNQPLPFNLHNRRNYGRMNRSVSTNTTPPRPTSSPDSPSAPMFQRRHNVPSYGPSRDPSPSIQTSRSTSSLHPGDASYLPTDVDADVFHRAILNVRLVRGPSDLIPGARGRQGRSITRGRLGRFGEQRGESAEYVNGKGKTACQNEEAVEVESPTTAEEVSRDRSNEDSLQLGNGGQAECSDAAPDRRAPFLTTDFKIEDVGSLSQSWGE